MARFLLILFGVVALFSGLAYYVLREYSRDLPDSRKLADYEPAITTRVYARGHVFSEYAREKRIFTPLAFLPLQIPQAFLSAEDKAFYQHRGLDFMGIIRAITINLQNYGTKHKPMGASTITQQVAKNFLLTSEQSLKRKLKEAILAYRIEKMFRKQHILELYLNEIYLGFSSYGVTAAAMNYFHKSLNELTVAETAFLAALPKAPNHYHPLRHPIVARERRDWVLDRMAEDGHITAEEAVLAQREPLIVKNLVSHAFMTSRSHFLEDVRRFLIKRYGEHFRSNFKLYINLNTKFQFIGEKTLRNGLITYNRRHGLRGGLSLQIGPGWVQRLCSVRRPVGIPDEWALAVILAMDATRAAIGLVDGRTGVLPLSQLTWARNPEQTLGSPVQTVSDVLVVGDVVLVEPRWPSHGQHVRSWRQEQNVLL